MVEMHIIRRTDTNMRDIRHAHLQATCSRLFVQKMYKLGADTSTVKNVPDECCQALRGGVPHFFYICRILKFNTTVTRIQVTPSSTSTLCIWLILGKTKQDPNRSWTLTTELLKTKMAAHTVDYRLRSTDERYFCAFAATAEGVRHAYNESKTIRSFSDDHTNLRDTSQSTRRNTTTTKDRCKK